MIGLDVGHHPDGDGGLRCLGGGRTWAEAQLGEPILARSLTRFRVPWRWEGAPAVLQSRAHDDRGNVQPTRAAWSKQYAAGQLYHCNAIQSWQIDADGSIANVYT